MAISELLNQGVQARDTTPKEFKPIKKRFEEAMENNTPILIERSALNLTQSVVIELEFVGDKWCMGKTRYQRRDGVMEIPYTISYVDLYTTDPAVNTPKIVFKGANPFG